MCVCACKTVDGRHRSRRRRRRCLLYAHNVCSRSIRICRQIFCSLQQLVASSRTPWFPALPGPPSVPVAVKEDGEKKKTLYTAYLYTYTLCMKRVVYDVHSTYYIPPECQPEPGKTTRFYFYSKRSRKTTVARFAGIFSII